MPKNTVARRRQESQEEVVEINNIPLRTKLTKKQKKQGPISWINKEAMGGLSLVEYVGARQDQARHAKDHTPLGKKSRCYQCKQGFGNSTPRTISLWKSTGGASQKLVCAGCYVAWQSGRGPLLDS